MANGYTVDLGQLESLVNNLETAEDSMNSANNALKDAGAKDLGSAGLDSAGKDFEDKWEYGIGKLADLAKKMTGGLKDTQKTYADAEAEIKKLFPDPGGAPVPAPGAPAPAATPNSHIGSVLGGNGGTRA